MRLNYIISVGSRIRRCATILFLFLVCQKKEPKNLQRLKSPHKSTAKVHPYRLLIHGIKTFHLRTLPQWTLHLIGYLLLRSKVFWHVSLGIQKKPSTLHIHTIHRGIGLKWCGWWEWCVWQQLYDWYHFVPSGPSAWCLLCNAAWVARDIETISFPLCFSF